MEEYNPMSYDELHDKGAWTVNKDGRAIESEDFTHDVILRVTGDFFSDEQRKAYAEILAAKLNVRFGSWISVKDRLPLEGEDIKLGYNSIRVIVLRGEVVHECKYIAWGSNCIGNPQNMFEHAGHEYITHWMPLPEGL